ncbi:MAG: ABC transporter permease [Acutalibacteraceae bacterium]|jgi:spermidine/putrescine transport system permease protein
MRSKRAAAPFGVWMTLFTVVPLAMVAWFAFTDESGGFTFANILEIRHYTGTFLHSLWLGLISTALCLLLGYPLALGIARKTERVQQTMIMLIMLPMWMNFLLRTYAWMSILENKGFLNQLLGLVGLHFQMINTDGAVVLGMVYDFLPFMVLPLYSVMTKLDSRVVEAAEDLGANRFQVFRRVILPLSRPGIVSGITMVFVPAVSTFVISKLLGGGKNMLIGDVIEMMFMGSGNNYNVGAALSMILMALMLICMAVMRLVDKDGEDMGGMTI